MDWKTEIIKSIQQLSGEYNPHTIFMDWVSCMAIAIQNCCTLFHDELYQQREKQYKAIIEKYKPDEQQLFSKMYHMFVMQLEEGEMEDVLGTIYMKAKSGNKHIGQFFTPFHVSLASAQLIVQDIVQEQNEHPLHLYEPSSGSGGMVIAVARLLKEKGLNYQRCMKVIAQDLDWHCVYMTYVQLSLYGINGMVVQGDTLKNPFTSIKTYPKEQILITPKKAGLLL